MDLLSEAVSSRSRPGRRWRLMSSRPDQSVFQTITIVLSNNGSDWIESSLAGGLTYAEFTRARRGLHPMFTLQFERTVDEIDPECRRKLTEDPWRLSAERSQYQSASS